MAADRKMTLIAFMQAQNCSNYPASWRHPSSMSDFLKPAYYQRIARTLEDGKFHLAFFDDRLAMPDRYGDDYEAAVKAGVRTVKLDLVSIMTAMGLSTSKLGIGGTYSTTYYEPYHVARTFATLSSTVIGALAPPMPVRTWPGFTSAAITPARSDGSEKRNILIRSDFFAAAIASRIGRAESSGMTISERDIRPPIVAY